ncbi:cobalamin B12-binding domain-containing protein [Plantactinospora sp. CA-290183]|uniref:cobalamin B12-binding domain-containing protein n=1 Tax=Plantactinospora sp. CA-290183 TaxID=3240006 RepID=UPI003D91FF87
MVKSATSMARTRPGALRVIVTGTSSDAHTWNLVFLQLLLEHLGHEVLNLGPCTPDALVVDSCVTHRPDLLVVSSVNGHGHIDACSLIAALRAEPATTDLRAVVGGKLGISLDGREGAVRALIEAGFDAVFDEGTTGISFESFMASLSQAATVPTGAGA